MLRSLVRPAAVAALLAAAVGAAATLTARATSARTAVLPPSSVEAPIAHPGALDTAVFAGGCFWGVEAVFEHVRGVVEAVSGYSGGSAAPTTYEEVGSGATGHAESVRVAYDPALVGYGDLLRVFFGVAHDPTQKNRQGPDVGPQYRSAIFYANEAQHRAAADYIARLEGAHTFRRPIVTELAPLGAFHVAEAYHQDFAAHHPHHPYIVINDLPKLARLRAELPDLYREQVAKR